MYYVIIHFNALIITNQFHNHCYVGRKELKLNIRNIIREFFSCNNFVLQTPYSAVPISRGVPINCPGVDIFMKN